MRHDRHSVMQASIRRRIALKHDVPTAKCGLMHACAWRRHDYYWASVTASRANPFHSMGGRPSHQTKVGHIAGSHVETSGQIMSLMAFSCNLSWPRKDNDFFFLFFSYSCVDVYFTCFFFTFLPSILSTPVNSYFPLMLRCPACLYCCSWLATSSELWYPY